MRFILSADALPKVMEIRQDYEKQKLVELNKKPSKLGRPTLFGGTNVAKRCEQICFIEKMFLVLSTNLILDKEQGTEKTPRGHLTASRMMLAVCLFVQDQITSACSVLSGKNAFLYQLINTKLGISESNYLDAEDKAICFDTAHALLAIPGALDETNERLRELKQNPISFHEWSKFKAMVTQQYEQILSPKLKNNYPFTSITKPLFGAIFAYAGASLGFLSAEVISKSTQLLPQRYYLSAGLSGIAFTLHTANPLGATVVVPLIINRILESFFQISLSHLGAVAFNILGQGVGILIGLPPDLFYHFCLELYRLVKEFVNTRSDPERTGLRISDGMPVINGMVIELKENVDPAILDGAEHKISVDKDGSILFNGQKIPVLESLSDNEVEEKAAFSLQQAS